MRRVAALVALLASAPALALDTGLTVELEARHTIGDPDDPSKIDSDPGIGVEAEFRHRFNDGDSQFNFTPFGRWSSRDEARRHADIRELYLLHVENEWEFLAGASRVFWGKAESNHLVDIVNQTDALEGFDGEDKLGQPMLRVSRSFDSSTATLFVLPGFREREFLDQEDPLALPFPVDNDPLYESSDGNDHVDAALRFSGYRGFLDYGLSWFHGTSRDPDYVPGANGEMRPFYPLIDQFGIDLQLTMEAWLWKLETIRRTFDEEDRDYTAAVGGFEYTIFGLADGAFDLGLLAEYNYDSRDDRGQVALQDDLFLATRFGFTDIASSELLAGVFYDLEDDSRSFRVEGNRRVFGDARLSLELQLFTNVAPGNIAYHLRDSDFIRLALEWFF